MKLGEVSPERLRSLLSSSGVRFQTGPFTTSLRSGVERVACFLEQLYPEFPVCGAASADFHVRLASRGLLGRLRGQVEFFQDWDSVFTPYPVRQSVPLLEWGLNWSIYAHVNHFLVIHAAVIERDGIACVMPGQSGAGKSTLCAALVLRGWRLLSDELALIDVESGRLAPLCRPIALKNESIPLIAEFGGRDVFLSPGVPTRRKGVISHLRPPADSVQQMEREATATHVIFPSYLAGAVSGFAKLTKGHAFLRLADAALNYSILRRAGFDLLTMLIERVACLNFTYARLDDAVAAFEQL